MTNYNDGKWHGHNGGECPVHPKTVVDAIWLNDGVPTRYKGVSVDIDWEYNPNPLIAFRVIKEYKEPREFWVRYDENKQASVIVSPVDHFHAKPGEIIHFREVL